MAMRKEAVPKATSTKASPRQNYTDPALRKRIKKKIVAGSKGGKPGQWSARKAQLLAHEYESHGGAYRGSRTASQKHLKKWTQERWNTSDGSPARQAGGTTRYLPKQAWAKLSASERKATNSKKRSGSQAGRQFVKNTRAAATAGTRARKSSKI